MFDVQGFEPISEDSSNASTTLREAVRETVPEFENVILEVRESAEEVEASMKSAIELAKEFKTSDRSIQNWYGIVTDAYSWLSESQLKTGTGKNTRYTALCIAKMGELKAARDAGQTANDWIASIQKQNPQVIASHQQSTAETATDVEVLVGEDTALTLPQSAIVPIAGTNNLTLAQQQLEQNNQRLQGKLAMIQQRLSEHQQQQQDNQQAFNVNLQNRKAQLLMAVAEQAIADKLEADQLYSAIVSGQLDLTPKNA